MKNKEKVTMNSLDKILSAMRTGKYGSVTDTKGNVHVGIINGLIREDGSGNNWLIDITHQAKSERVFIHAK